MCRINERVYIRTDGNRSKFQDPFLCDKGRRNKKICSDARIHIVEYHDPTSSPMPSSPLTPTNSSRTRRGSTSSRPSTKDGPISSLKSEIHIEIGSKKGKGKSYVPTVTVTTGKSKRESTGSTYTYESPGSETSHTVRTGFPDISPPPLKSSHAGLHPQHGYRRNLPSDASFSGSSHIANNYQNSSDYDTPSLATGTTATSSGSRPIIHDGRRTMPSPPDTARGHAGSPSVPYRTTEFVPKEVLNETSTRAERSQRPSSSYGASAAPEITDRGEARERQRAETRRRQEALDRDHAAAQIREENAKHVRFETGRAQGRAQGHADERAQQSFAAQEQRQADDREHIRQQRKRERDAHAAKEAAAKVAAAKEAARRQKPSRRDSVRKSAAQAAEQQRLLEAEAYQMEQERIKVEAIEHEERMQQQQQVAYQQQPIYQTRQPASSLQQPQHDLRHFDPRGHNVAPGVPRRNSQSGQTRPTLGRTPSKRGEAPQARESHTQPRQPPVSFYNNPGNLPQTRERRPSQGTYPLGQSAPTGDPWDVRNMAQALPTQTLPSARGAAVGHNFPQPQHATHRMNQAIYPGEYETDSEDEKYRRR